MTIAVYSYTYQLSNDGFFIDTWTGQYGFLGTAFWLGIIGGALLIGGLVAFVFVYGCMSNEKTRREKPKVFYSQYYRGSCAIVWILAISWILFVIALVFSGIRYGNAISSSYVVVPCVGCAAVTLSDGWLDAVNSEYAIVLFWLQICMGIASTIAVITAVVIIFVHFRALANVKTIIATEETEEPKRASRTASGIVVNEAEGEVEAGGASRRRSETSTSSLFTKKSLNGDNSQSQSRSSLSSMIRKSHRKD
jgi:hypothetical protein